MSACKLSLFVVGPQKSGKTTISNYIADLSESLNTSEYHSTEGVRILEFDRKISIEGKKPGQKLKEVKVSVELWDCSGNPQFHACWSAFASTPSGVLLVFSPDGKQEKELDNWYNFFPTLRDSQFSVFAHKMVTNQSQRAPKVKLAGKLGKLPLTSTILDDQLIKQEFDNLIINAYNAFNENRDREEQSIVT